LAAVHAYFQILHTLSFSFYVAKDVNVGNVVHYRYTMAWVTRLFHSLA